MTETMITTARAKVCGDSETTTLKRKWTGAATESVCAANNVVMRNRHEFSSTRLSSCKNGTRSNSSNSNVAPQDIRPVERKLPLPPAKRLEKNRLFAVAAHNPFALKVRKQGSQIPVKRNRRRSSSLEYTYLRRLVVPLEQLPLPLLLHPPFQKRHTYPRRLVVPLQLHHPRARRRSQCLELSHFTYAA